MPATKEQVGITVLVLAWVVLTWLQSGFSIAANVQATKWSNGAGGETDKAPPNWHGSQWMDAIAIILSIGVPAGLLYLNSKSASGTPAIAAGSVLSGQSLTSWM
jgi:hypothetical protein